MKRSLALLVCACSLLFLPRAASAKPKVALTEIEGDTSGDVHAAVVEALGSKELAVVSGKEVNRAAAKIGDVADFTEKDLKKLATQLEADAVVIGKLERTGATRSLKFRLFIDQKMAKGFTVSFKDPRSPKFRVALHDKMVEKLGGAGGAGGDDGDGDGGDDAGDTAGGDAPEAVATTAGAKSGKTGAGGEADTKAARRGDGAAASSDKPAGKPRKKVAAVDKSGSVEASSGTRVERAHTANLIPVRLDVGVSVARRSFAFNTATAGDPRNVALSPGPGVRIDAELYPLALTDPGSPLARLGLAIEYDKSFALEVKSGAQAAPVSQSHYGLGVRYRYAFGMTELSPTLTLGAGFGKRSFSPDTAGVDAGAQADIAKTTPSNDLTVIDPGVAYRYPLNPRFAVFAALGGMLVLDAGPVQENTSYGQATVYGIEGSLGVDIVLSKRFVARVAGELAQISYSFKGGGALTDLNGDPATQEVKGLTDRSLGASATLGVLY